MRFHVTVSQSTGDEICRLSERDGRSVSNWVARIIESYISKENFEDERAEYMAQKHELRGVVSSRKEHTQTPTGAPVGRAVPAGKDAGSIPAPRPPSIFDGHVPLKGESA